jgi:PhnB protein
MEKQVWGDEFGACVDKFGISWMINSASRSSEVDGRTP